MGWQPVLIIALLVGILATCAYLLLREVRKRERRAGMYVPPQRRDFKH